MSGCRTHRAHVAPATSAKYLLSLDNSAASRMDAGATGLAGLAPSQRWLCAPLRALRPSTTLRRCTTPRPTGAPKRRQPPRSKPSRPRAI